MPALLTLQTPRLSDYSELVQVWEDSVRATHHFLPEGYILLLRDHVAKQRQREFAAQMMAMQVAEGQRRLQAIIQALEAAAQPTPIAPIASVEQPDAEPMTLQAVTVTPDAGYSPPPPPPR